MYKTYEQRLKTFDFWTSTFPAVKLAKAGFIYSGENDVVVCPSCDVEGFNWLPEDDPLADHMKWSPTCEFFDNNETYFITRKRSAIYREKSSFESRLVTFQEWPIALKQQPQDLAMAGYFYTGRGDRIKCYYCGIEVKDLLPTDDIRQRHAATFDKCLNFLQQSEDQSRSNLLCKVCWTKEISIVFMPCKHLASCVNCLMRIDNCCICRTVISGYIKVYIS